MLFNYKEKLKIKNKIDKLTEDEWIQIFYILKNNNESYTINKNGLFFDLINITNSTLEKIKNYIDNIDNVDNIN